MLRSLRFLTYCTAALAFFAAAATAQPIYPPQHLKLSPNDSTFFWKDALKKNGFAVERGSPFVWKESVLDSSNASGSALKLRARQAAAIDPHILLYPETNRQPAGIVIVPQQEIDPEMVKDPGPDEKPRKIRLRGKN